MGRHHPQLVYAHYQCFSSHHAHLLMYNGMPLLNATMITFLLYYGADIPSSPLYESLVGVCGCTLDIQIVTEAFAMYATPMLYSLRLSTESKVLVANISFLWWWNS